MLGTASNAIMVYRFYLFAPSRLRGEPTRFRQLRKSPCFPAFPGYERLLPFLWLTADAPVKFADIELQLKKLVSALKEDAIWQSPARREELLNWLRLATVIRAPELGTVLVPHLAYSPYEGLEDTGSRTVEKRFPVTGAVVAIGLAAVPSLLKTITESDPEDRLGTGQQQCNLAVYCLCRIYAQGGFGREMAIRRLELEIEKSSGIEKERLRRILAHPPTIADR